MPHCLGRASIDIGQYVYGAWNRLDFSVSIYFKLFTQLLEILSHDASLHYKIW